jgi:hypothetical protein
MTKLRYVPDSNEAYALEKQLTKQIGFTFNAITIEGLLSRWTFDQIVMAVEAVYVKATMGCDSLLAAVESYLETAHP